MYRVFRTTEPPSDPWWAPFAVVAAALILAGLAGLIIQGRL